jgi:hypothetical protein
MGEVIRKGSAAPDVLADVATTLHNARAKGGVWASAAEEKLGAVEHLSGLVTSRLADADKALKPLTAALAVEDDRADDLIGAVSDDLWNAVGRPAADPVLSIIFPGGIAYYTEGRDDEQPDRMELLAEFLGAGLHPKLDRKAGTAHAKSVREAADAYRKRVDATRKPAARVKLLNAMQTAVGRYAHTELANLKRRYKSEGFSESDIHAVIPDRPRPSPAATAPDEPAKPATP